MNKSLRDQLKDWEKKSGFDKQIKLQMNNYPEKEEVGFTRT